jgi:antitoxin ParD1/3/4
VNIGIICQPDGRLPSVPTRNVVLTTFQEQLIQSLLDSGRYQNASEVIRDGLRLIERREAEDAARLEALRAAAEVGIAALDNGAFSEFSDPGGLENYLIGMSSDVIAGRSDPR